MRPIPLIVFVALLLAGLGVGAVVAADRDLLSSHFEAGGTGLMLVGAGVGLLWVLALATVLQMVMRTPPDPNVSKDGP